MQLQKRGEFDNRLDCTFCNFLSAICLQKLAGSHHDIKCVLRRLQMPYIAWRLRNSSKERMYV